MLKLSKGRVCILHRFGSNGIPVFALYHKTPLISASCQPSRDETGPGAGVGRVRKPWDGGHSRAPRVPDAPNTTNSMGRLLTAGAREQPLRPPGPTPVRLNRYVRVALHHVARLYAHIAFRTPNNEEGHSARHAIRRMRRTCPTRNRPCPSLPARCCPRRMVQLR